jgi:GntR family transcriptional regulator
MTEARRGASKYRQIADDLRASIRSGELAPGDRVPGENALMESYGVARMTARQALGLLLDEGIIVTRAGSGTHVRRFAQPIIRDSGRRLARSQWEAGKSIWSADVPDRQLVVDQVTVGEESTPIHVRAMFGGTPPEQVVVRRRRFTVDGKPVTLATSYLPAQLVAGTPITQTDTGPGGTYARLAELGAAPAHFREDVHARMPDPDEIDALALVRGTPVLTVTRIAMTDDGATVEVTVMTMDASAYVLRYDFDPA